MQKAESEAEVGRLAIYFWIALFFGVGSAIALAIAIPLIDRGASFAGAVFFGAYVGGVGAWLTFFTIARVCRWIKKRSESRRS